MKGGGSATFKRGRTWMRTCVRCRETKPLRTQFYKAKIPPRGGWASGYRYYCKDCEKERGLEWRRRRQADPAFKRRLAEKAKRERKANPQRHREADRRWKEKLYADPKRHIPWLEDRRIEKYLRREKKGTIVTKYQPAKMVKFEDHLLPAKPLYTVATRYIERRIGEHESIDEACKTLGVTGREYRRWTNEEQDTVRWETADKILTALGLHWWDVWDESEVPERIAA